MKNDLIKYNNIEIEKSYNISYKLEYGENPLIYFLYKHLFDKYNIILSRYITKRDIDSIKHLFYESNEWFDEYMKNRPNNVIFIYDRIILYDYISPTFIYYYIFMKKYIYNKFKEDVLNKKLNILDISYTGGLLESCLFSYYNDNITNINYYKLNYYSTNITQYDDTIINNTDIGYKKIIDIYKDLKNYATGTFGEINYDYINKPFNINDIHNIINYYKTKKINLCNLFHICIRLKTNNGKIMNMLFNHFIEIYIFLNVLEDNGTILLTLDNDKYDYYLYIFNILNSLFDLEYPNFLSNYRKLIILRNYKKNIFINHYLDKFNEIINNIDNYSQLDDFDKITNIFKFDIDVEYKIFFNKLFRTFNHDIKIKKYNKKINKICNIEELSEKNKCFYFDDLLKLTQLLYDKYYLTNIKLCLKYNLDIKPNIKYKYDEIITKLIEQSYNMNYDNIYIIDNINDSLDVSLNNIIKLNTNYNNNYDHYNDYINNSIIRLKLIKFYIDSRKLERWRIITDEINIRKSIIKYVDQNYNIKNSRAFVKMYDILNIVNVIDINIKQLNSLHVCEAPGNFINAINYYIKSNNKDVIYNWNANSLYPIKGTKILGDFFGFIRRYPDRWDWLDDKSGDITKLNNLLYIINKYKNINLYTSDCGTESNTVEEMLDQENKMILTTYSQIIIGIMVNKIGGHMIVKLFLPISRPLSYCLLFLLHQIYQKLYFIKQSSGSLGSSEFYIVGYNKLRNLSDIEHNELLKIYKLDTVNSNYSFYDKIPQYFIDKLNNITELFIKEQIKYIKRSFIYYDNDNIFQDHKIKYFNDAKKKYCEQWIIKNNFKKLDKSLML